MPRKPNTTNSSYNDPLPTALRSLMKDRGITQDKLAKALCVSRQMISQYCSGASAPSPQTIAKIAKHFNVSADYLLGLGDEKELDPVVQEVYRSSGLNAATVDMLIEQRGIWSKNVEERNGRVDLFLIINKIIENQWFWTMAAHIRELAHDTANKIAVEKNANSSELQKAVDVNTKKNNIEYRQFQVYQSASRIAESIVRNMLDKEDL